MLNKRGEGMQTRRVGFGTASAGVAGTADSRASIILAQRKSVWQSRNWTMLGREEVQLMMGMRRRSDQEQCSGPCVSAKLHATTLRQASGVHFEQVVVRAAGRNQQFRHLVIWVFD